MNLLVNIDVPDLARAIAFYGDAFGLRVSRRLGPDVAELSGWAAPVYLLHKSTGAYGAVGSVRTYERHWTPIHFAVVVDLIADALARALAAGARAETDIRVETWGKIVTLADPFGHGFCLIEFWGRGYDEIAYPAA